MAAFSSVQIKQSKAILTVNTSNCYGQQTKLLSLHLFWIQFLSFSFFFFVCFVFLKDFKFQEPTFIFKTGYFMRLLTGRSIEAWLPAPHALFHSHPHLPLLQVTSIDWTPFPVPTTMPTRAPLHSLTSHPAPSHIPHPANACVPHILFTRCRPFWSYPLKHPTNTFTPYDCSESPTHNLLCFTWFCLTCCLGKTKHWTEIPEIWTETLNWNIC